jgi:SfnB family sulfur acquisition oxidoreductase
MTAATERLADPGSELRRVPALDDETALSVATELAGGFAIAASQRDRDRVVPHHQVEELAMTGLLAATVPAEYNGSDIAPTTLAEVFRIIAHADPSIAAIPHSHFVSVNLLKVAGTPEQKSFFFGELLRGGCFGNAQSEPTTSDLHVIDTRITRSEPGWFRLNGRKGYCTGALFATWIPTLARLDDGTAEGGEELIAFVPRSASGVTVVDDWNGMGQRTTASGRVEFDDVRVPSEHIIRRAKALDRPRGYGAFSQLLHAATHVGIAGGALSEAAEFVRHAALPYEDAHVHRAQDDPLVVQRFGELTVDVRGAEAALRTAAEAVTEVLREPSPENATEALLAVGTATVLGERAALATSNAIFEVGGTRAAMEPLNLHRHWRNARTHSLADPISWKYHHLGRYTLLGISPPRHTQI